MTSRREILSSRASILSPVVYLSLYHRIESLCPEHDKLSVSQSAGLDAVGDLLATNSLPVSSRHIPPNPFQKHNLSTKSDFVHFFTNSIDY